LNPHVAVLPFAERLTSANALGIVRQFDIVVDGSDNFPTRYLVNDACVLTGRPLVSGSILRFDGQLSVFDATRGPCYRCLFSEPPPPEQVPSCAEGGVLGVLPGIIGSLQALETMKLILGVGEPLVGRLLVFDGLRLRFRELRLKKDPACPVCGPEPTVTGLIDYEAFCGVGAPEPKEAEIEPHSLLAELSGDPPPLLLDVREPWEHELVHIGGARLIPLSELPARLAELPGHAEIVTYCHKGVRSLRARELLRGAGFGRVRSLAGGIDRWAAELEPGMTRY
jgi:adenylyltransferase/sulfurtransferase